MAILKVSKNSSQKDDSATSTSSASTSIMSPTLRSPLGRFLRTGSSSNDVTTSSASPSSPSKSKRVDITGARERRNSVQNSMDVALFGTSPPPRRSMFRRSSMGSNGPTDRLLNFSSLNDDDDSYGETNDNTPQDAASMVSERKAKKGESGRPVESVRRKSSTDSSQSTTEADEGGKRKKRLSKTKTLRSEQNSIEIYPMQEAPQFDLALEASKAPSTFESGYLPVPQRTQSLRRPVPSPRDNLVRSASSRSYNQLTKTDLISRQSSTLTNPKNKKIRPVSSATPGKAQSLPQPAKSLKSKRSNSFTQPTDEIKPPVEGLSQSQSSKVSNVHEAAIQSVDSAKSEKDVSSRGRVKKVRPASLTTPAKSQSLPNRAKRSSRTSTGSIPSSNNFCASDMKRPMTPKTPVGLPKVRIPRSPRPFPYFHHSGLDGSSSSLSQVSLSSVSTLTAPKTSSLPSPSREKRFAPRSGTPVSCPLPRTPSSSHTAPSPKALREALISLAVDLDDDDRSGSVSARDASTGTPVESAAEQSGRNSPEPVHWTLSNYVPIVTPKQPRKLCLTRSPSPDVPRCVRASKRSHPIVEKLPLVDLEQSDASTATTTLDSSVTFSKSSRRIRRAALYGSEENVNNTNGKSKDWLVSPTPACSPVGAASKKKRDMSGLLQYRKTFDFDSSMDLGELNVHPPLSSLTMSTSTISVSLDSSPSLNP